MEENQTQPDSEPKTAAPPAEAQKPDTTADSKMVSLERFNEVNNQLKKLQAAQAKADKEREETERKALEAQNNYKELYEKAQADLTALEAANAAAIAEANERLMKAQVIAEATKAEYGIAESARPDVWTFIDREKITADENGNFIGIAEAVTDVVEGRPYLVTNGQKFTKFPRQAVGGKAPTVNAVDAYIERQKKAAEGRKNPITGE